MAKPHKPLFNRRYLKALLLILPGAILLLSSLGPTGLPEVHHDAGQDLYWIEQPTRAENDMRLMFATRAALAREQRIDQQALADLLRRRLDQPDIRQLLPAGSTTGVEAAPDRLELRLRWPAGKPSIGLVPLLRALSRPPQDTGTLGKTLDRLRAQAYLAAQQPEQRLLDRLQDMLVGSAPAPSTATDLLGRYRALFDSPPLLVLGGPDAERMARRFASDGSGEQPAPSLEPTLHTARGRLTLRDPRLPPMQLLGATVAGIRSADYPAELLAIKSLQQLLQQQPQLRFRLVWQPLGQTGYRALVIATPADTLQHLATETTALQVSHARQQLQRELSQQLASPDGQVDRLATIAFYRLPDRHLDGLSQALKRIPEDDIVRRIQHYLTPDGQILIELNTGQEG